MDEFAQAIEQVLSDIDAIVLENEKLRSAMFISVREWQMAYCASVLILAIDSLSKRKKARTSRLMADELVILIVFSASIGYLESLGV